MTVSFVPGRLKCGVDIGGTFVDLVLLDEASGQITTGKCLTTPDNPARGVIDGLQRLLSPRSLAPGDLSHLIHATTLMTNALIEGKGVKTALITTRGFRDILEIRRENRYDMYDLFLDVSPPLVPRRLRREVTERIRNDGSVIAPLDEPELRAVVEDLVAQGVEAVAVCLLHAYMNPMHERRARDILKTEYPHLVVSISSEVAPEIREYERTVTTVANAYVQPLAERYLGRLEDELEARDFTGKLSIMLSSGGISTPKTAKTFPIRLLESGPAAGALIASYIGSLASEKNIMAFDMGGTTAKICLVEGGSPRITYAFEAARASRFKKGSGLPLKVPTVELIEIGAGGGSIAHINALGLLKVGPESAGAAPGPACYDLGGSAPTVTDADLILGYLNPAYFLGGQMALAPERARDALERALGGQTGLDAVQAAWGVHEIANENMATAARIHVAEKGRDPRRYTLVATGGAGPVHAYRLAAKLGISRIIFPLGAGVGSAIGLLVTPPKVELVRTLPAALNGVEWESINALYAELEAEAVAMLTEAGVQPGEIQMGRQADMRYVGQGFEIVVPLPEGNLGADSLAALDQSFHDAYVTLYGRSTRGAPLEALNWRLTASGPRQSGDFSVAGGERGAASGDAVVKGQRAAYFPELGGFVDVSVYDRYRLRDGDTFEGPAIVEERESTVVIGPGARAQMDAHSNLIVELPHG